MFHQELRSFNTEQLSELIKEKHIYEDNLESVIDLIESRSDESREKLNDMDFGEVEYLAHEVIGWMDREELLEFIDSNSLFII